MVGSEDAKRTMDAARDLVGGMVAAAGRERDRRIDAIRERERVAAWSALGVTTLGLLLLAVTLSNLLVRRGRTARIRAALEIEHGRLAGTVANLRDGIAVFDRAGALVVWNGRFFDITGLPATLGRVGAQWTGFVAEASGWSGAPLGSAGSFGSHEVHLTNRVVELWQSSMPDGGHALLAVDITRRTRAEAAAREANRMEALGQLTGGVAHDFNNLLQVVSANLELIGLRVTADPVLSGRTEAAMSAVERASRLTRHLLAFARRQPLAPEVLDPAALLGGMDDMLHRTLGQAVQLTVTVAPDIWAVRADPAQLENAILNLCLNGRDAMPDGGQLTVEAANASLDAADPQEEVAAGDYVVIAIADTGTGMGAEQLSRALEPFYSTKPEGRGTGLGLPMVFGFAKQSGGHFRLSSELGQGTAARLYLPRSAAAPDAAQPDVRSDKAESGSNELILVVEDDPDVRASAVLALEDLGYRTRACGSAAAALDELHAGLRPDLLFSDVVMPGTPKAREMADEARRLVPSMAVVFTSGYTDTSVVHDGQIDPDVILVGKPWRTVDLARALRAALDRAAGPPPPPQPAPAATRILLVEDDMLVRMTTAELLGDLGHDVIQAGTAAEARRLFGESPDVVVTDIGLPDEDGLVLAAEFRARAPHVPIVLASGRAPGSENGFIWLQKPYDSGALKRAIARAVEPVEAA